VDHFTVSIRGRQTHGAQPHQGIDPVVTAAQAILALQTIPSRTLDPIEPVVVTVGMIHGGERRNIIPAEVRLEGTVRTYSPEVRDTVERRMAEILAGITSAAGGSFSLDYDRGTLATVNDPELARRMLPTVRALLPEGGLEMLPPTMGGEDFAYFADQVPGFFFRLGTLKEGTVSGPHHSPTFRADDDSVVVGVRVMSNLILDYLLGASDSR
jgi:amidohydrolase